MDWSLSEELTMVRDTVREFVQNELLPVEREVLVREKGGNRGAPIARDTYARLKKLAVQQGLWAMAVPEALGGGGLNCLGACLVAEELGKTFVRFDFGDVPPVLFDGTQEQRDRFLAPLIAGEKECRLAVREPGAEDSLGTRASPDGTNWRLNGVKLAEDADLFLVLALADAGATWLVVEKEGEGVVTQDGKLILKNALVPSAQVLGDPGGAFLLGARYQDARWVRAAARKIGVCARLLEMSAQYARDWKALGQALLVRPAVRRYLAEMAVEVDAARWLVYHAACEIDAGREGKEGAARAGLFASDVARRAIDRTIEIYGGPAHLEDLPLLRVYREDLDASVTDKILERHRSFVANKLVYA